MTPHQERWEVANMDTLEEMIRMLSTWIHSGFPVFYGNRISLQDETTM